VVHILQRCLLCQLSVAPRTFQPRRLFRTSHWYLAPYLAFYNLADSHLALYPRPCCSCIIGPMKMGASCVAFLTTFLFLHTIMFTKKELILNVLSTPRTVRKGVESREQSNCKSSIWSAVYRMIIGAWCSWMQTECTSPRSWCLVDSATSALHRQDLCCFLGCLLLYSLRHSQPW